MHFWIAVRLDRINECLFFLSVGIIIKQINFDSLSVNFINVTPRLGHCRISVL